MDVETEVKNLKKRVDDLQKEIAVFTPPISRLQRDLWEFREETNRRFDAVDARFDAVDARFEEILNLLRPSRGG